jgi:protein SCO1/2
MAMPTRLVIVIFCGLLLGTSAGWLYFTDGRALLFQDYRTVTTGAARVGGPFQLIRHDKRPATEADFQGLYMLVFFGATRSPELTPAGLQTMTGTLEALGPQAQRFVPLFITVDPEWDQPDRLAQFIRRYHPRMVGLTGSRDQIAAVAKSYHVHFSRFQGDSTTSDLVDHTALIYVMNTHGAYVAHFSYGTPVAEIVERLRQLP